MRKLYFGSIESGLGMLKKYYLHESETTEGEFADWMVSNMKECFKLSKMEIPVIMGAIQAFRQWAHDRDELEDETFAEIVCEYDGKDEDFQNYVYPDGSNVPYGTRVGLEVLDTSSNEMILELDSGIFHP